MADLFLRLRLGDPTCSAMISVILRRQRRNVLFVGQFSCSLRCVFWLNLCHVLMLMVQSNSRRYVLHRLIVGPFIADRFRRRLRRHRYLSIASLRWALQLLEPEPLFDP